MLAAYFVVRSSAVVIPSFSAALCDLVVRVVGAGGDLVHWAFLAFGGMLVKSENCKKKNGLVLV